VDSVQVSFVVVRVDATLISLLEVVTDVDEFGRVKMLTVETFFGVTSGQACEPVIRDAD
jgi:hypothetical protein